MTTGLHTFVQTLNKPRPQSRKMLVSKSVYPNFNQHTVFTTNYTPLQIYEELVKLCHAQLKYVDMANLYTYPAAANTLIIDYINVVSYK
jgi:hypothetical protein